MLPIVDAMKMTPGNVSENKSSVDFKKKARKIEELPDEIMVKVFKHLESSGNSFRVCRSFDRLAVEHATRASIKASRKIDFSLLDLAKFSNLTRIEIDGFQHHFGAIPPFKSLSEFVWTNCANLKNEDLAQIAQSKDLTLVSLTGSKHFTGLGMGHLLSNLSHLTNLEINLAHLDELASNSSTNLPLALKSLSLDFVKSDVGSSQEQNTDEFKAAFKREWTWLVDNMANLQSLCLIDCSMIKRSELEYALNNLKSLKDLDLPGDYFFELSPSIHRLGEIYQLTSLRLTGWYSEEPEDDLNAQQIFLQSPKLASFTVHSYARLKASAKDLFIERASTLQNLEFSIYCMADFQGLFSKFNKLTGLHLFYYENGADHLSEMNHMPSLRSLGIEQMNLNGNMGVLNSKKMRSIAEKFPNLTSLVLRRYKTDEKSEAWKDVCAPNQLENLDLMQSQIGKGVMTHLVKGSSGIKTLSFLHGTVEVSDLHTCLSRLPKLENLTMGKIIEDNGCRLFQGVNLPRLTYLEFISSPMKLDDFRKLSQLSPNLISLHINTEELSFKSLISLLRPLQSLKDLSLFLPFRNQEPFAKQYLIEIIGVLPCLATIALPAAIYTRVVSDQELANFFKKEGILINDL